MLLIWTIAASAFTPTTLQRAAVVRHRAASMKLDVSFVDANTITHAVDAVSNLLAGSLDEVSFLDTNPYGGKGAFSQSATGQAGDLNLVLLVGVGFPTLITGVFYKDNIASIFEPPPEVEPPKGWKKVPSQSRPGKFSYLNQKTGERYDRIPNSAWKD